MGCVRQINAKRNSEHIWSWSCLGTYFAHVYMSVYLCAGEGQRPKEQGERCTLYFSFLAYQPWRASVLQLKAMHLAHVIVRAVIATLSAQNESNIWPFLNTLGSNKATKNPLLPLARNVPALPQPSTFTRSSSRQGTQLIVYTGTFAPTLQRFLLIMSHCSVTSQLFAYSKCLKKCRKDIVVFSLGKYTNRKRRRNNYSKTSSACMRHSWTYYRQGQFEAIFIIIILTHSHRKCLSVIGVFKCDSIF